jgi:hypothetical protein
MAKRLFLMIAALAVLTLGLILVTKLRAVALLSIEIIRLDIKLDSINL